MVAADALIAAAYFSISLAILRCARQRGALPSLWVPGLFSAFIFACGLTHVLDIWTIWQPDYKVQVLAKGVTAALSIATAIALWKLLPQALKIPSVARLQQAITSLEAEVGRRLSTEQRLADLAQGKSLPPFDTVRQARDGTRLAVSVTISPIRDAMGRVVGASKIARDVAQQRRAEAALRESAARLRFVLDSAQIGEWELDLDSGHIRRSDRVDACFGLPPGVASWTFDSFLRQVHAEDHAEVQRSFQAAVRNAQDWQIDCRVHWPDQSEHWLRLHGALLPSVGPAARMLGIVSDITAQRQAEDARLRAQRLEAENRQVLEASRLKSQFLANMSHELRTPLNAIIGFAELLQGGAVPATSPKHHQFLGHIASSGHHSLQLINDVQDLAKVESGKFDFTPESVDLPQMVGEALAVLSTAVQRKRLAVEVLIAPKLAGLVLDPARFKQVLYNWLSNAIKFTPDHGRITVRAATEGAAHFRVEVEDTGIDIAAADLPGCSPNFSSSTPATASSTPAPAWAWR